MININMSRKDEIIRISIGAFDVENNVLTLLINAGEYDLTGKTITAIFEGKPETAPLIVEEGIIKLPIIADLVEPGINKIQLNFRWDVDKLEQSPILWWTVNKSLLPEGVAQESIDIISYLISEVNRVVVETGDIKEALDDSVANANTINDTLTNEATGTIKVATDTGIDLEDTIDDANFTKGLLEATIDDSEAAKTNLEGTILAAGTGQTNLNSKIVEAATSKQVLEQAIIDNQIVKQSEFNAHKEDYANQRAVDNLKVATVEKGLNDYKSTMANVNVNQEDKQKVTGYGTISLPKNTANGQISVSVKGNTRTNLSSKISSYTVTTNSVLDIETLQLTAGIIYTFSVLIDNKGTLDSCRIRLFDGSTHTFGSVITGGGKIEYSVITFTPTETKQYSLQLQKLASLDSIAISCSQVLIEKASSRGAYISSGTKSTVSASRLKSVGRNFIRNGNGEEDIKYWNPVIPNSLIFNGEYFEKVAGAGTTTYSGYFKLPAGQYTLSSFGQSLVGSSFEVNLLDESGINILVYYHSTLGLSKSTFTIIEPKKVRLKIMTGATTNRFIIKQIKLEQGTIVTPYEPYKESTQYLPNVGELRSLPNGTKDEVMVSGGKAELVKRVSDEYILQNADIESISTLNTNVDVVFTKLFNNQKVMLGGATPIGNFSILGKSEVANATLDNITNVGAFTLSSGNGKLVFIMAKGTTLAQAQTALAGTKLTYQLAEPIITPIEVSGNLVSYPSGTVYVERVVADAGIYTTKFDIKELQLPIKSVDKLIKYNFTTGVQTALDANLAVINADKKSFTHPNLINKDMVFVDYFYDMESTLGETTIEYLDSRYTIKDTTNNKFYSWSIKSTNGVPTVSLLEVL